MFKPLLTTNSMCTIIKKSTRILSAFKLWARTARERIQLLADSIEMQNRDSVQNLTQDVFGKNWHQSIFWQNHIPICHQSISPSSEFVIPVRRRLNSLANLRSPTMAFSRLPVLRSVLSQISSILFYTSYSLIGKPLRNKVDVQTEFCQIAFQHVL